MLDVLVNAVTITVSDVKAWIVRHREPFGSHANLGDFFIGFKHFMLAIEFNGPGFGVNDCSSST